MRVITRQNIWHHGDVHPAGSLVDLSDELASQLISDGLVESAEPVSVAPQESERVVVAPPESEPANSEIEQPKKQTRKRKK